MEERTGRRSPRGEERRRDPQRTRARILDAASTEFGAHGYAGARIGAIASRAGVNQQLISYYFDGKQGLYDALAQRWRGREAELVDPGLSLTEQLRRYVMEAVSNPEGVRLLAWSGLEYDGPGSDPDQQSRSLRMSRTVDQIRALQEAGDLPRTLDPAALTVMLVAVCMAPTALPHVVEGVCGADARSEEFVARWADQVAALVTALGPHDRRA